MRDHAGVNDRAANHSCGGLVQLLRSQWNVTLIGMTGNRQVSHDRHDSQEHKSDPEQERTGTHGTPLRVHPMTLQMGPALYSVTGSHADSARFYFVKYSLENSPDPLGPETYRAVLLRVLQSVD
jgi:hypothetical protein